MLLALGIVAFTGHTAVRAQSADDVVERLRTKYDSIDGLRATFTQTMSSEFLDAPESSSGVVLLSGKRIRIETANQTFVTDGAVTWLYDSTADELLINDYIEEEMFPVREFLFDYDANYEVVAVESASVGNVSVKVVRLRARDESTPYREVSISVRDTDDVINQLDILDVNDTRMVFMLQDIELNPQLGDDTFSFTPPDGASVIDLRS